MKAVLVTGGSGHIATAIRPHLAKTFRLRLTDLVEPVVPVEKNEEFVQADLVDVDAMTRVSSGADLVVHLGGYRQERAFGELLSVNIGGTQAVLEAAQRAGVRTVLLASSVHAVGYATVAEALDEPVLPPRPDSLYGVSKVACEALGSLYADRFGMTIVSARIAAFLPSPVDRRGLSLWSSPGDMARLVAACADLKEPGHHIVWGVSANSRSWVRADAGEAIGYYSQDDAEHHASEIPGIDAADQEDAHAMNSTPLGGDSVTLNRPLGTDWDSR